MPYLEQEGKNTADALVKASRKIGVPVEKLKFEVIDEGSKGIFNILSSRPTKIRVDYRDRVSDLVREKTQFILDLMEFQAEVEVGDLGDGNYQADIRSNGLDGLLIGRKGQTLDALQHLVNRMVNKDRQEPVYVILEVGGYRERRDAFLKDKPSPPLSGSRALGGR